MLPLLLLLMLMLLLLLMLWAVSRLDEDEKVLSPEELLYRCVHYINQTHDKVTHFFY